MASRDEVRLKLETRWKVKKDFPPLTSTPSHPIGMCVSKMKSTLQHNWLHRCVGKDKLGMGTFENTHKLLQRPSALLTHSRLICTKVYREKWCHFPTSPTALFIFSSIFDVSGNVQRNYLPLISSAHIFHEGVFFFLLIMFGDISPQRTTIS